MTGTEGSAGRTFEAIRHEGEDSAEHWLAREFAPVLGYQDWRNFLPVIDKARIACTQAGLDPADHFGDVTRMIDLGKGARRELRDVR